MRYSYFLSVVLFVGVFFFGAFMLPLYARAEAGFVPVSFAAPLMQWVALKTGVAVPYLPRIAVSRDQMIALIGNPQRQAALARALYVPNMVVIDEAFWNPSDTRTVSFLVHELVHHAQLFSRKSYPCANAKEWEAYHLQNMWLAEHNLPPAVEENWIATMASCDQRASPALAR